MTFQPSDTIHHALAGCGERLKQAREAAGLSIDDVAGKLHMPARIVRSLEAEDWSKLGAPVFVRGQVRSYSRLMGLATVPMMDAMQITVSSEMAKRIDDSSSAAARRVCGPVLRRRPWVEAVMEGIETKRRALCARCPPLLSLVVGG